jgi:hypothetical protein
MLRPALFGIFVLVNVVFIAAYALMARDYPSCPVHTAIKPNDEGFTCWDVKRNIEVPPIISPSRAGEWLGPVFICLDVALVFTLVFIERRFTIGVSKRTKAEK